MNCQEITKKIDQIKQSKQDFDDLYNHGDRVKANKIKNGLEIIINEAKIEIYNFIYELSPEQKQEFHQFMIKLKEYEYNNHISLEMNPYFCLENFLNKYLTNFIENLNTKKFTALTRELEMYYSESSDIISILLSVIINNKIKKNETIRIDLFDTELNGKLNMLGVGFSKGCLIINGDAGNQLGYKMDGGIIKINGSVKRECGYFMKNGKIIIDGNAGSGCGFSAHGGKIEVKGNISSFSQSKAKIYNNGVKIN